MTTLKRLFSILFLTFLFVRPIFCSGPADAYRTDIVLNNIGYRIGWNNSDDRVIWAYYILNKNKIFENKRPKQFFKSDKRVNTNIRSLHYNNSGYDRGHLAPSFAIGKYFGAEAQIETFLITNIAPQYPHINRVIIKNLELQISNFAFLKDAECIEVFVSIIYTQDKIKNKISIPESFNFSIISTSNNYRQLNYFRIENKKK